MINGDMDSHFFEFDVLNIPLDGNLTLDFPLFTEPNGDDTGLDERPPEDIAYWSMRQCSLVQGNKLVSDELRENLQTINVFHGKCSQNEYIDLILSVSETRKMAANIYDAGRRRHFFVEPTGDITNNYKIYRKTSFQSPPIEETLDDIESRLIKGKRQEVSVNSTSQVRKLRLAVLVHSTFSEFHGGTLESAMFALLAIFSRVNAIFFYEASIFFELVAETSDLICLNSSGDCDLPSDNTLVYENKPFFEKKGVSEYDIGHSISTHQGGIAFLGGACLEDRKELGFSGQSNPVGDPFAVDYVCHEIGHQLGASHTYRDCRGPDDNQLALETAVEPGSGSTIMAYAGVCPGKNVQSNSDPLFHPVSLAQLDTFKINMPSECGETFLFNHTEPEPSSFKIAEYCRVPLGNSFRLAAIDEENKEGSLYSWDNVQGGYNDFLRGNLAEFRSWMPSKRKYRDFPDLHHQIYESSLADRLPTVKSIVNLRYTRRLLQNASVLEATNVLDDRTFTSFDSQDTEVEFIDDETFEVLSPLSGTTLRAGEEFSIALQLNEILDVTEFLGVKVAENNLQFESNFTPNENTGELDWIDLGDINLQASTTVFMMPVFSLENEVIVNLMIFGSSLPRNESEMCYFYELFSNITVIPPIGNITEQPTSKPTQVTPTPTNVPTKANDIGNTSFGDETASASALAVVFGVLCVVLLAVLGFVVYKYRQLETQRKDDDNGDTSADQKIAVPEV